MALAVGYHLPPCRTKDPCSASAPQEQGHKATGDSVNVECQPPKQEKPLLPPVLHQKRGLCLGRGYLWEGVSRLRR